MRCYVCGKETPPRQRYCDRCRPFITRNQMKRRAALRAAYDKGIDRFRCRWSRVPLEEKDHWDPFHLTFDHIAPMRTSAVVASSLLFNQMKSELTPDEFLLAMQELAAHRAGRPFDRDLIEFKHWRRKAPSPPEPGPRLRREEVAKKPVPSCVVCGRPPLRGSSFCPRCRRFILSNRDDMHLRAEALRRAWSPEVDGFICQYTGVRLEEDDPWNPWYLTFDHAVPGDRETIVVAAYWVNSMKTALSADEFRAVVMEYDRYLREGGEFDKDVVDYEYWRSMYRERTRRSR